MALTKITAKIHPILWKSFGDQVDTLYLKKAAYLNQLIAQETVHLKDDLAGRTLSLRAKRHISGELKRREPTLVNIEVEKSTADSLNKVVDQSNLVRDAFINRLLFFFLCPDQLLTILDIPHEIRHLESVGPPMPMSPAKVLAWIQDDPFSYLRQALAEQGEGLYSVALSDKLAWMACYLEDIIVPGTKAFEKEQQKLNKVLTDFFGDDPIMARFIKGKAKGKRT